VTDGLVVEDVKKTYAGFAAVGGVSLTAETGTCLAVVGPNGAGKSTLFAIISGQTRPDSGKVLVGGADVTKLKPDARAARGLSRTFQVARLFNTFTVRESVVMAMQAAHRRGRWSGDPLKNKSLIERSAGVLDLVRMGGSANRLVRELTQGERKRLEFGMAFAQNPSVLVLDEPTAGMGREDTETVMEVLRDAKSSSKDLMILLTAHDMEVIFGLADRLVVMAQGKVLIEGEPKEVANHPTVAEVYLGRS
jgi:branched-chain amino acid transport system ATP-binding protein